MEEDAQRALKEIKEYDGQKLSLTVAKSKIKDKDKNKKGSYEDMFQNGQLGESCVSMVTLHLCHLAPTEAVTAPKENQQKGSKKKLLKARLIIRNLSFKVQYVSWLLNVTAQSTLTETFANTHHVLQCTEDHLKEVFAKFGTVIEVKIPLKPGKYICFLADVYISEHVEVLPDFGVDWFVMRLIFMLFHRWKDAWICICPV